MAKLLVVKAMINEEISVTNKLVEAFINEYKVTNPDDTVDVINTYDENIQPLTKDVLGSMYGGEDNVALKYASAFASYDKIVFAAPMWNLSIPASLKSYIDYVCYNGVAFKYTEQGPVGLLSNKVVHITSRGGIYSQAPMSDFEMGDRYLRTVNGFMGTTSFETVSFDGTNYYHGEENEVKLNEAIEAARSAAKTF